ncbi:MAG: hypothetical protein GY803_22615 [Chloroflexi bacterium]|nr:hypothetical protein [Chloroflexota bacterium]
MKRYLWFILLILLVAACKPPDDSPPDTVALPTLAVAAEIVEEGNNNTGGTAADGAAAETSSEAAVVEEAESAAEESSEEGEGNEDEGPTPINLDDFLLYQEPQNINYLTTLEFYMKAQNADGEMVETGRVYAEGSRTVEPNASTMRFDMFGAAGGGLGGETMTITQIENMFYYVVPPNECITFGGDTGFDNPFDLFLDTGGMLNGDVQRVLPNQTINGVESRHYVLKPDNLVDISVQEIYDGDLFVAEDGDFVTRLSIYGKGRDEVLSGNPGQEGEIYYELNFIPKGEIAAIMAPEGCGKTMIGEDLPYPILEDAVSVISMEGVFMYETHTTFEEIIAFYKRELTKDNEWSIAQEMVQAPNAAITFTGAGGTLMVNLGPGQEGRNQVGIILTP